MKCCFWRKQPAQYQENFFSNLQIGYSMQRLAAFIMFIFFASILTGPSKFMLSIEKGNVYTEKFSLGHIIKAAYSPPAIKALAMQSDLGTCRFLCHRHIKLTICTIPEESFVPVAPDISDVDFLPVHTAFISPGTNLSQKQLDSSSRLKLPISTLLRSPVLLI